MIEWFFAGFAAGYLACVVVAGIVLRGLKRLSILIYKSVRQLFTVNVYGLRAEKYAL